MPPPSHQEIAELKNTMRKLRRSLSLENKELQQLIEARKHSTESSSSSCSLLSNREPSDGKHSDLENSCCILVVSDEEEVEVEKAEMEEGSDEEVIILGQVTIQTEDQDKADEEDNDMDDETDDVGSLQQENNIWKERHDADFGPRECEIPKQGAINKKNESWKQLQGICSGYEEERDSKVLTLEKYKAMKEELRNLRTENKQLEAKNAILREINMRYKKESGLLERKMAETKAKSNHYESELDKLKTEKMKLQEEKDAMKEEEKRLKQNWKNWEENHAVLVQKNVKLAKKEHGIESKLRRLNNLEEDRNSFDEAWAQVRKMNEEAKKQTEAMEEKQLYLEVEKRRLEKEWEKFNLVKQGLDRQAAVLVQKERDLAKEQERIDRVSEQQRKEPAESNPKQDVATWTDLCQVKPKRVNDKQDVATWTDPCQVNHRLVSDSNVSTEGGPEDPPHRSDSEGGHLQVSGQEEANHSRSPVLDSHSKLTNTWPEPRKASSQQGQRRIMLGKRQRCNLRDTHLQCKRRRGLHPDFLQIHLREKELIRRACLARYRRGLWATQDPYRGSFYQHDIRW